MKKIRKIDLSKIPLISILVLFIVTYFIYKDFNVRMLYGYAILGLLIFLYTIYKLLKRKPFHKWNLIEKIYVIMPITIVLAILRKDVVKDYELLTYIIAMMIGSTYLLLSENSEKEYKYIVKIIYITGWIFAIWEIINLLFPQITNVWLNILSKSSREYNLRMIGKGFLATIGGSLTYVDYIMGFGVAVSIAEYMDNHKKVYLLSTLVFMFTIVIIGRRGELLAAALMLITLMIILDNPNKRKKHIMIGITCIIISIMLFIYFMPILKNIDFLYRYIITIERMFNGEDFSSGRFELYSYAIEGFKQNPIIGIGWGNYKNLIPEDFRKVHGFSGYGAHDLADVHNIYLQFFCETGIIGATLIIGVLLAIFIITINTINKIQKLKICADEKFKNNREFQMAIISFGIQLFFLLVGILDPVFSKRIFWFIYPLAIKLIVDAYNNVQGVDFKFLEKLKSNINKKIKKKKNTEKIVKEVSIKKNFIMNIILTVSSVAFPMITFPYISRILSPEGTGVVSFATSFVFYFYTFAQLGIPTYGIRICAQVRDNKEKLSKTVHELLIIQLIMSFISYVCYIVAIFCVPKLKSEMILYFIVGLKIFFESVGMEWLFKALEQYSYITKRSVILKFISLILMFLLVKNREDYRIYAALLIFADTASNIMNIFTVKKFINIKWMGNYNFKKHLKSIVIFFAMVCATTIYTHLDIVMLGFMKSDVDVGYYNVSMKVKTVLVSLVTSLGVVLLPRTSYYVENNKMNEFWGVTRKAMNFVMITAIPIMIYFIAFAKQGVLFIAGNQYQGAIEPLKILMPTLVIIGITNILGIQILVPLGKEKYVLYSQIVGAIVDIVLNILLIPHYASSGAAIGTLFAELSVLIVQIIALRKNIIELFRKIQIYKIFIALIPALISVIYISGYISNEFISLITTSIVFFGIYGTLLLLSKEKLTINIWNQIKLKLQGEKNARE